MYISTVDFQYVLTFTSTSVVYICIFHIPQDSIEHQSDDQDVTEKEAHEVKKLLEQKDSQCALKIQEEVEKAKTEWRQTLIGTVTCIVNK